ncbi:MAG: N-acyl homoserine lactonase family protein [Bacteroidota bacterium]|nr:N-acyl homoserine lactonase family protein [Bacteroidota bacterium]
MKNVISLLLVFLSVSFNAYPQEADYKVYAIKFAGTAHPWPISDWVDHGPANDSVNIDFVIWLMKGNNGKNILLDAGFLNDIEDAKDFGVTNYVRPDSALSKLNVKAEDITDIILSHPHWDHMDGLSLFPKAHVWIQKEDYNYFVGASWQKGGNKGGFNKRDIRLLVDLNLAGRLTLVDGDQEIFPGVHVYTGSRHTFNSQYVLVKSHQNKIVLASDNIWVYYSLQRMRPPSAGGTFDTTAYKRAMLKMKSLASNEKFIIPGHDATMFLLFPVVAEGVVKIE